MMLSEKDILLKTLGMEIDQQLFPPAMNMLSYQQILDRLTEFIRPLLDKDFNQVIHILYRIDVPEQKVTDLLNTFPDKDAGSMIAGLILERTLEKIQTRKQFGNHNINIPDEEKW